MNTLTQLPDEHARELAAMIATMQQLSKPAKERWLDIGQGIAIGCSLNKKEQKKEETK